MSDKFDSHIRQNLVWAGSSGIILAFVHAHPELWFISFFALVPFLRRLFHVGPRGSVELGVIMATTYMFATGLGGLILDPKAFLLKLVTLNIAFAVFAYIINRVKRRLGFNPLLIALLWFPIAYVLLHFTKLGTVFFVSDSVSNLIVGFCSLFGILVGSLVVILGNSLILLFIKYVEQKAPARKESLKKDYEDETYYTSEDIVKERIWHYLPEPRSPPIIASI